MPPPLSPLGTCFFSSRELRGHAWKPSAQGNPCTPQGPGVNGGVGPIDTSCYQSATATRTQDSNRENRCVSSVLAFVQSHPDTLAGHGPLLQVYTTSSVTDLTDLPRPCSQGWAKDWSWLQVSLETRKEQATSAGCAGSFQHFNTVTWSSAYSYRCV